MSTRSMARPLGAVTLIVAGALVLGACSSSHAKKKAAATTTSTTAPAVCPLTGAPSPLGTPPNRPALAVKVDNYQAARPQSGLDDTDLVFEEPVEGGITRYVAVFQCNNATSIGPVRSARNIDIGILGQLGNPGLAHVGGINPVLSNISAAGIPNLDLGNYAQAITHPSGRYAPYDTYTSTAALYGILPAGTSTAPPKPIYTRRTPTSPGTGTRRAARGFASTTPHSPTTTPTGSRTRPPTSSSRWSTSPTGRGSRTQRAASRSRRCSPGRPARPWFSATASRSVAPGRGARSRHRPSTPTPRGLPSPWPPDGPGSSWSPTPSR